MLPDWVLLAYRLLLKPAEPGDSYIQEAYGLWMSCS